MPFFVSVIFLSLIIPMGSSILFAKDSDEWDKLGLEDYEDPMKSAMNFCLPAFLTTNGEFNADKDRLHFQIRIIFNCEHEEGAGSEIKDVWVNISTDNGSSWEKIALVRTSTIEENQEEIWEYTTSPDEITLTSNTKIQFFFTAEQNNGYITTELPITNPGWPPDTSKFFFGVKDIDNPVDVIADDFDILETYIARDTDNIYLILRVQGEISTGTLEPPYLSMYISKFNNPINSGMEGIMVGKYHAFAPLIFPHNSIIDINRVFNDETYRGRLMDRCDYHTPNTRTGVNQNLLFTQTPIKEICESECEDVNIMNFTAANASLDTEMPIPMNSAPNMRLYLRSHQLNGSDSVVQAGNAKRMELKSIEGDYEFSNEDALLATKYITTVHEGKGPFKITPCDIIYYKNFRFEAYTRDYNSMKLRIFKDNKWLDTMMIEDNEAKRYLTDDFNIKLSDIKHGVGIRNITCMFEIELKD